MRSDIASIRTEVARLRQALLSPAPASLEQTIPGLESAVGGLRQIAEALAAGHTSMLDTERLELRAEVAALRGEIEGVARLATHGADFWCGWARLLGLDASIDASYTPLGAAVNADLPRTRIVVEG